MPTKERISALVGIEGDLIRKTNLHPVEAQVVSEGALLTLDDVADKEGWAWERAIAQYGADVKREGDSLLNRYQSLVRQYGRKRGPEGVERNPGARPTDWNWSLFLDW
jgi:hypothetical protein